MAYVNVRVRLTAHFLTLKLLVSVKAARRSVGV